MNHILPRNQEILVLSKEKFFLNINVIAIIADKIIIRIDLFIHKGIKIN